MRDEIFWIPGPWRGRLAIVMRPRGGDWVDDDVQAWRDAGIDVVVSLLEPLEEAELSLTGESASSRARGLEFWSLPIPDRGVPKSHDSATQMVARIVEALNTGRNVALHCRQSVGRSALIAAAALMSEGQDLGTTLDTIERARGVKVPETHEQCRWIADFASWLAAVRTAKLTAPADRLRRRPSG